LNFVIEQIGSHDAGFYIIVINDLLVGLGGCGNGENEGQKQ
jgi:hypothetical protein